MVPETLELQRDKEQDEGRLLWLTDTYGDHNGVSTVLKGVLQEIRLRDLPIDLLICSSTIPSGDHLIVVPPVKEFIAMAGQFLDDQFLHRLLMPGNPRGVADFFQQFVIHVFSCPFDGFIP